MRKIGKKGSGFTNVVIGGLSLVVVLFLVNLVFGWVPMTGIEKAQPTPATPEEAIKITTEANAGDLASLKVRAYDQESATLAQVAGTLSCWDKKDPTVLLSDGATMSSSDATTVSPVTRGSTVVCDLTGSTYYGDATEKEVKLQGETMSIPAHTIATTVENALKYRGAEYNSFCADGSGANTSCIGLNLSANEEDSFDYLWIKNSDGNSMLNFKGILIDLPSDTNVTTIKVGGMVEGSIPKRISDVNYYFQLSEAKVMTEFQTWTSGTISVKADGDGASSEEVVTIYEVDEQDFKSVKDHAGDRFGTSKKGQLIKNIETDADTPAQVGGSDFLFGFTVGA